MCKFITKWINKNKAKKIISHTDNIEAALNIFETIALDETKYERIINSLLKDEIFGDVISRYRVCIQNVKKHNEQVEHLFFAYNSILNKYPISYIIENIEDFPQNKLIDLCYIVDEVYKYFIPTNFKYKKQYDQYKNRLADIKNNYQIVQEQKSIIILIEQEISNLPDKYIDESNLYKAKKLLSTFNAYPKKYYTPPLLDCSVIENHNEKFITRHIKDAIFDNVNGKSLDTEQRRAVLCDAKSNLTIAGAGSGKTLTICGKVKYLLENHLAEKENILLLSYSRASADDLAKKVNLIDSDLTVETFHSLGLHILTEANGKKKAIEEQLKTYIKQYFDTELTTNPKIANEIFRYIALYFYAAPTYTKKYKNDGEIYNELKSLNYRTLKDRLGKLTGDKFRHETLKNEFVKSNEELVIANFLFTNGINYEYERPYEIDTSTLEKRQYTPDFYLPDYNLYIEHYGIDKNGNAPQYTKEAGKKYIESMRWKRETHKQNGTICIETYSYEFQDGLIFDNLTKRLKAHNVKFNPLSQTEVFDALHNVYSGKDFSSLFNLITTFLSLYKAQIKDDTGFETLKKQLTSSKYDSTRTHLFLDICKNIYNYYMYNLRKTDKIDFDDMILQSTDLLDSTPNFKYKYIIVDEFQDISQSRTKFLQKLIEHGNSKLFAVGDDWQAIYRFAGCDINVFLNFDKIFQNSKLNYITSTHRNSSELQEIIEPFITANPGQYKKHIKSVKHQDKPVRIIYHNGNKSMALTRALSDIVKINSCADVLILGRNRRDIDSFICKQIQVQNYTTILHSDFPTLNLTYSTVHGSKGLECDFVILISGENAQNGFPNKTEDDDVLNLLLGKKNPFKYAEERRLFYVALTRTKSIVYLLSDKNKPSEFITEIKNKCYIMYDESKQKNEDDYLCPWCKSGHLVIRSSESDKKTFYGCSNFPYCTYTNNDMKSVYNNLRCPECGDFLTLRKGKYGKFLGCHNYPRCKHTQQIK